MPGSIFSTYSTGENRVTASIIAVLKSLSLGRIERLLGSLLEQSEFELVQFRNQVASAAKSVPDAEIHSSCRLLIETKIKRDSINIHQLRCHLEQLDRSSEVFRALLVLTPDDRRPAELERIERDRLVWASFAALDQAIEELITDPHEVISEREEFLLRELQQMLIEEELVSSAREVVVVPARRAWPQYQRYQAYICQPHRTFQPVQYVAFYCDGCVQPLVPRVVKYWDEVQYDRPIDDADLACLVDKLHRDGIVASGNSNKIMMLTGPDDPQTVRLKKPVVNDLSSESGRTIAFTQSQRYVSLERLRIAKVTSDLLGDPM